MAFGTLQDSIGLYIQSNNTILQKPFLHILRIEMSVKEISHPRSAPPLLLTFLLVIALTAPATGYGRSVEDLVGSFSIGKSIKIGSDGSDSSECASSGDDLDPLAPPAIGRAAPLSDDQPPSLAGLMIEPQRLSIGQTQRINLTAHLIDDQAVSSASAAFTGPSDGQAFAGFSSASRISGTAKDGFFEAELMIPANETGEWHLQNMTILDLEGNGRLYSEADLAGLGISTVIPVIP